MQSFRVFVAQTVALTHANLKSRYRNTLAGFVWVVLNPLLLFGVQALIFKTFLKLNISHYLVFLVSGLLPWVFMIQSIEMCTSIFVSNSGLLKSTRVNPLVYLSAQIFDNFINFLAAFMFLLIPVLYYESMRPAILFLLPIPLLILVAGVMAMSWLLATSHVFFRDTRFLVNFGTGIAYYITPIFYPPEFVPEKLRWILELNPLHRLILPFRLCIYSSDPALFWPAARNASLLVASLFVVCFWVWKQNKGRIYVYL